MKGDTLTFMSNQTFTETNVRRLTTPVELRRADELLPGDRVLVDDRVTTVRQTSLVGDDVVLDTDWTELTTSVGNTFVRLS